MEILLAVVAVCLVVLISALYFFGLKYLANSVISFSSSVIFIYFAVQGIIENKISICGGRSSCLKFSIEKNSGEFWVAVALHFIVAIFLVAYGIVQLRKSKNIIKA